MTKNLDDYIDSLKSIGELNRGKIHFEILTGTWMDKSVGVKMYRYKNGYYCWLNGLIQSINLVYLTKIVEYFASDSRELFCYNETIISPKVALNIFNKRIDSINIKPIYHSRKLFELNCAVLYFQNDSLICKGSNRIYGQINYLLPFSVSLKDFITVGETIYVIENNEIINKIELTEQDFTDGFYEQCWVETFPKWINFNNVNGFFLSYSIQKNKFYKL